MPAGTLLIVRMASTVSSTSAHVGDRFQGFLDHDLAVSGRVVATQGSRVFGQVVSVDKGDKMKGQPALGVALTDIEVGGHVVPITTQPLVAKGEKGTGGKKMLGGAALGAGSQARSPTAGRGRRSGLGSASPRGALRRPRLPRTRRTSRPSQSSPSPWPRRSRCRRRRRWPSTERPEAQNACSSAVLKEA